VVISGKGGTGKTSITASLATLVQPVVVADCDVDAPDLHILTGPRIQQTHPFSGGKKAYVVAEECCGCGRCVQTCRFDAIREAPGNDVVAMTHAVDPIACEGCGACVHACPAKAIRFEPVENGHWYVSQTRFGPMVHARMHPGEDNSGKLVSTVRREARHVAASDGIELILVDGSPGVGCPVIASLTNADLALIVAEPTPSGFHDALRVIELARKMHIPTALCVNRWDVSRSWTERLESDATDLGVTVAGRIRDDAQVVVAQMENRSIVESADIPAAQDVRRLWRQLQRWIAQPPLTQTVP
jgi:MinD superfamily P-loop ATPase